MKNAKSSKLQWAGNNQRQLLKSQRLKGPRAAGANNRLIRELLGKPWGVTVTRETWRRWHSPWTARSIPRRAEAVPGSPCWLTFRFCESRKRRPKQSWGPPVWRLVPAHTQGPWQRPGDDYFRASTEVFVQTLADLQADQAEPSVRTHCGEETLQNPLEKSSLDNVPATARGLAGRRAWFSGLPHYII